MLYCDNYIWSIMQVFAELPSLSFIKSASLIGHNNSQEMRSCQMQDTISKFRDGRVCLNTCISFIYNARVDLVHYLNSWT